MSADNKTAPIIGSQSAQIENTEDQVPSDNISSNNKIAQDDTIVNIIIILLLMKERSPIYAVTKNGFGRRKLSGRF